MSPHPMPPSRAERPERLQLLVGAECNNNCIFCMESDRDYRRRNNATMTLDRVRDILAQSRDVEEICFTSGEPTTRPDLLELVSLARAMGFSRVSIMTNGRRLSHPAYAEALARAGVGRFYVSLHGHTPKLHEGHSRTPESFAQTVGGIEAVARLGGLGVTLSTSTVVTRRNLPHLAEIYRFVRALGASEAVFNVMQPRGRGETHFERLFPRYSVVATEFHRLLASIDEPEPRAVLVDIPPCLTETIAEPNRGFVERCRFFLDGATPRLGPTARSDEPVVPAALPDGLREIETRPDRGAEGAGVPETPQEQSRVGRCAGPTAREGLTQASFEARDAAERVKREACAECRYEPCCEGVWRRYVERFGWEEMVPVRGDDGR